MNEIHKKMKQFCLDYSQNNASSSNLEEAEAIKSEANRIIQNDFPIIFGTAKLIKQSTVKRKAEILFEMGKILNYSEMYEADAEHFLSAAVKYDPSLAEAWFELAHCVSKKNDMEFCISCLERSIKLNRVAKSLASLAIALRIFSSKLGDNKEKIRLRDEACQLLKEAISIDPSLGLSFVYLGTSYFVEFFNSDQKNPKLLDEACSNYKKALNSDDQKTNPELHLNYATALRYQEEFEKSLHHLQLSCQYDPKNNIKSKERLDSLITYLQKLGELIEKKGKLKAKRLQMMSEALKNEKISIGENSIKTKVIGAISHDDIVPLTIGLCDVDGNCFALTIYNCAPNFGFVIGDTLTIQNPEWKFVKSLQVKADFKIENLKWCRVQSPRQLKRNNIPITSAALAHATVSIEQG